MPFTQHGHWYGEPTNGDHDTPPPQTPCGGPHWCDRCALEAARGHQTIPRKPGRFRRLVGYGWTRLRWGKRRQ
jgi:hypothetical protein